MLFLDSLIYDLVVSWSVLYNEVTYMKIYIYIYTREAEYFNTILKISEMQVVVGKSQIDQLLGG